MKKACQDWLKKWKGNFGTHDGLPSEFHRECIYGMLGPQMPIAIVTPHGNVVTGKTVMLGPAGWVACDDRTGGARPLLCGPDNTVWIPGLYFKGPQLCRRGQ